MADTKDYLTVYKRFFDNFAKTVDPDDQLPVRVAGYRLWDNEIVGETVDWTLQYLSQSHKVLLGVEPCDTPVSCSSVSPVILHEPSSGKSGPPCFEVGLLATRLPLPWINDCRNPLPRAGLISRAWRPQTSSRVVCARSRLFRLVSTYSRELAPEDGRVRVLVLTITGAGLHHLAAVFRVLLPAIFVLPLWRRGRVVSSSPVRLSQRPKQALAVAVASRRVASPAAERLRPERGERFHPVNHRPPSADSRSPRVYVTPRRAAPCRPAQPSPVCPAEGGPPKARTCQFEDSCSCGSLREGQGHVSTGSQTQPMVHWARACRWRQSEERLIDRAPLGRRQDFVLGASSSPAGSGVSRGPATRLRGAARRGVAWRRLASPVEPYKEHSSPVTCLGSAAWLPPTGPVRFAAPPRRAAPLRVTGCGIRNERAAGHGRLCQILPHVTTRPLSALLLLLLLPFDNLRYTLLMYEVTI
ncbi:Uncharacterized protein GBIM_15411 [Gryllus bimaculatus]|nr:Uncharacterized protein GBIM_15411 [Gryllus bimaculatus]